MGLSDDNRINADLPMPALYVLDGKGSARRIERDEIRAWRPRSHTIWIHLDRATTESQRWLKVEAGLPAVVVEALLADASRPRFVRHEQGFLLNCRGVNLNPGTDPDDMVAIKIWAEPGRIITTRHRYLLAIQDVREDLEAEKLNGPSTVGDLVVAIADRLLHRMGPTLTKLEEEIADIEVDVMETARPERETHVKLSKLRIQAIGLRRYLSPQRQVFSQLQAVDSPLVDDDNLIQFRELGDRLMRIVEDLDAARERASVIQDDITQRLSERMERVTLVLTVVAAIFLPLGLLTGLLGINTAGIPGAEQDWAFGAVVAVLLVVALGLVGIFRKAGML